MVWVKEWSGEKWLGPVLIKKEGPAEFSILVTVLQRSRNNRFFLLSLSSYIFIFKRL